MSPPIYIVLLRRPRRNDRRTDPFYEFGSFGLTGCHRKNILNPKKAIQRLSGARLAFLQGGSEGARLICLTPPVEVRLAGTAQRARCEGDKNCPSGRFLKYSDAPVITDIDQVSLLLRTVHRVNRSGQIGE